MNLEDLKTIKEWAKKATAILARRVEPIGTELDILGDVIAEIQKIHIKERDFVFPGLTKAWREGIIAGAIAMFRDKVKKDIMPVAFAKDDNLILEPLYRPAIFGLTNFTVTWSGVTPPASIPVLNYNLVVDKELIILTDIAIIEGTPPVEIQISFDGEELRPYVTRKDYLLGDVKIYELPFPVVADINIGIKARVETASGSFTYLPVGIHACLGSIHKKTLA